MAFDFPNSPTVGQIFTSGNLSWEWDGQAWRGRPSTGLNFVRNDQSGTINGSLTVTELIESSSITLKENVRPIEDTFGILQQLKGVIYNRKDGSRINEPGLIAEDVAEHLPNVVSNGGIGYTRLIAYLVEAVKELKLEIETLKKQK